STLPSVIVNCEPAVKSAGSKVIKSSPGVSTAVWIASRRLVVALAAVSSWSVLTTIAAFKRQRCSNVSHAARDTRAAEEAPEACQARKVRERRRGVGRDDARRFMRVLSSGLAQTPWRKWRATAGL